MWRIYKILNTNKILKWFEKDIEGLTAFDLIFLAFFVVSAIIIYKYDLSLLKSCYEKLNNCYCLPKNLMK